MGTSVTEPTIVGAKGPRRASAADVLDNLPTTALDRGEPRPPRKHQPLTPGTRVGRYLIVEHIGAGGLGDVYKAYDPELDRRIAIKLLRIEVVDANRRLGDPTDRLRREAQALAKLRHPNVVLVHDVGLHHGEVFIAMEYAEGRTLLPWARAKGHDWRAIRGVFVAAGEGLAAAHDAGLVHRDFKPANVVVGDDGHVTVLDFGLARAVDGVAIEAELRDSPLGLQPTTPTSSLLETEVTGGSLLLGTPPYMAPELFAGEPATTHSDQFAFCVALYRVLFDRLPFLGPAPTDFVAAIRRGEVNFAGNQIPGWLTRVIIRGLRASPSERFADMRALLAALQTDRRRRRNRLVALAVLVPLAGAASTVGAWMLRPAPTEAQRAVTEELANAARAAAGRGDYVYPPPEDASRPTALSRVLELEALEGSIAAQAAELAQTLRDEFAEALIRHGDRYWDRPGGAPFAADFYATALVFDPDNEHAGGRVALSPAQLATLVQQAERGEFTEQELVAARPLAILATPEEDARDERLREFLADNEATPMKTRTMLEGLVRGSGGGKARRRKDQQAEQAEPAPVELEDVLLEPDSLDEPPDARATAETTAAKNAPVDRKRAAVEAKDGSKALRQGDLDRAAACFHRALQHDRRNREALEGLAELHYERGEYAKAVKLGERGRSVAPRSKRLLILIGDAHFKMLDYANAREAYERAQTLGSKTATARIARLDARLGK